MSTDNIGLSVIRTDGGTQARAGLDEATVTEYLDAMRDGAEFPPVVLFYDGTDYWLGDGFHRVEARRRLKDEGQGGIIAVDLRQGTRRDAVLFAAQANASHGLRRSADDKRRAVMCLLNDEEWGKWSDREIARRCHVSPTLVGRLRSEVVTVHVDSEPVERTYITKHGNTATMQTANIGNGGTVYESIHSLQNAVLAYHKRVCVSNKDMIASLEHLKENHKSAGWGALSLDLGRNGKIFRNNDLRQAVNNALDSMRSTANQTTISQPSEPVQEKELPESLEQCLLGALHRLAAPAVWEEWREKGITNDQLREMLSYGWGLGGGTSGPGTVSEYRKGGANPRFWYNAWGPNGTPTLQGAALIAKVREVLELPLPQTEKHWGLSNGMAFWKKVNDLGVTRSGILEFLQPGAKYLTDLNMTKEEAFARLADAPRRADPYNPTQTVEPVAAADGEHCLDCGRDLPGGGVCDQCFDTCVTDSPAPVLNEEQARPEPEPDPTPFHALQSRINGMSLEIRKELKQEFRWSSDYEREKFGRESGLKRLVTGARANVYDCLCDILLASIKRDEANHNAS